MDGGGALKFEVFSLRRAQGGVAKCLVIVGWEIRFRESRAQVIPGFELPEVENWQAGERKRTL
jgi:hypothetical protein